LQLADDTGAFDTLNKVLLAEEVDYYKREHYEDRLSAVYRRCEQCLTRIALDVQYSGDTLDLIEKEDVLVIDYTEQTDVEIIRPLPCKREQEYRYQHRDRDRENDLEERLERTIAVDVRRLLKLIRHAREELSEHEYEQSVLERKTRQRKHDHWRKGSGQLYLIEPQHLQNSEITDSEVEVLESHEHRVSECLVRNYHREDDKRKEQLSALELILCKSVSDYCTHERLQKRTHERKRCRAEKSVKIALIFDYRFISVERRSFRNKLNRYVDEVFASHEGRCDLRIEREEDDVRDSEKKNESEQPGQTLRYCSSGKETQTEALEPICSFKIDLYSVLGFSFDLRRVYFIHTVFPP